VSNAAAAAGDFIITSTGGHGIILDRDGDVVWWYSFGLGSQGGTEDLSRVHMSTDGKSMWGCNLNVMGGQGRMFRIDIDGEGQRQDFNANRHHDLTVLPDNSIAYIEFDSNGQDTCDKIVEMTPSGQTKDVFRIRDHFGDLAGTGTGGIGMVGEWCHTNAIHYVPEQDAYYISVLNQNMVIKFKRSGEVVWAMGNAGPTQSGVKYLQGVSWTRQHGHHAYADGRFLLFNNGQGGFGGSGTSKIIEFELDENGGSARELWNYSGGGTSNTLGDVQKLSNGNILVVYSNSGTMHEVPAGGQSPVRTISAGGFGYVEARASLYGDPDRF